MSPSRSRDLVGIGDQTIGTEENVKGVNSICFIRNDATLLLAEESVFRQAPRTKHLFLNSEHQEFEMQTALGRDAPDGITMATNKNGFRWVLGEQKPEIVHQGIFFPKW